MKAKTKPFTLKQLIVMLLVKPEQHPRPTTLNPTLRHIQNGLKLYCDRTASIRQIRRSLSELESEDVLARRIVAQEPGPGNGLGRASYYVITDLSKAFQNITALKVDARKHRLRKKRTKITLQRLF